jgi:hypothetical protein
LAIGNEIPAHCPLCIVNCPFFLCRRKSALDEARPKATPTLKNLQEEIFPTVHFLKARRNFGEEVQKKTAANGHVRGGYVVVGNLRAGSARSITRQALPGRCGTDFVPPRRGCGPHEPKPSRTLVS